jgi:hypothetical protein
VNLDERMHEIVSRLTKGTPLDGWDIQITIGPIAGEDEPASDVSFIEPEERCALLRLDPNWTDRTILTLEELAAHELGHILIADLTDLLPDTPTTRIIEERLASRVGRLLISSPRPAV